MKKTKDDLREENVLTDSEIINHKVYGKLLDLKGQGLNKLESMLKLREDPDSGMDELKPCQAGMISSFVFQGVSATSEMSDKEIEELSAKSKKKHSYTLFKFLNSHYGLRKGEIHTILGSEGSGKSTLIKRIALDCGVQQKTLLYLTEEGKDNYKNDLNIIAKDLHESEVVRKKVLYNVSVYTELELDPSKYQKMGIETWRRDVESLIINTECEVFILDNFSTSVLSESDSKTQAACFMFLKKMASKYDIPILIAIHPAKSSVLNSRKLEFVGNDIRGNSMVKNAASFIYVIQTAFNIEPVKSFIKVAKARGYSDANSRYYELNYRKIDKDFGYHFIDEVTNRKFFLESMKSNYEL